MPGIADNGAQIQTILQLAQSSGVGVYDGNVIGLGHQIFGNGTADLTGSQDDDAQSGLSSADGRGTKAPHITRKKSAIVYLPPLREYRQRGPAMA
jgi:hypothetical protein